MGRNRIPVRYDTGIELIRAAGRFEREESAVRADNAIRRASA